MECMKRPANLFLIPCEHHICYLCAFPLMVKYYHLLHQIPTKGPIARVMDEMNGISIDSDFSIDEIIFKKKKLTCPTCFKPGSLMYSPPNKVDVGVRLRKYHREYIYEKEPGNLSKLSITTVRKCRMCDEFIDSIILPCYHSELCYKCSSRFINQEKDVKFDENLRIYCPECGEQCRVFIKERWVRMIWDILFKQKIKRRTVMFFKKS